MTLASVYPLYLAKVEKKGRTRDELDTVIGWLTGYDDAEVRQHLAAGTTFADFFAGARLNPNAELITGVICGVRVEAIEDPLMQQIALIFPAWVVVVSLLLIRAGATDVGGGTPAPRAASAGS